MIGSGRSIRGAPRGGSTPTPQNNAPRGTPTAAAQNAFRGIIRIVTPAVNLINRVVQGVTGGRGGIAQLARGLTGLVNRAYQQATGQAWGAQGGTSGGTSGTAADESTGEEDTPSLPSPLPDIGESDDRLRTLNEEEEEVRPFNWNEFFGDDFTLEDIGDSVRESAENFLRFVRGEVDTDAPLLTQVRTLFERVGVTMTEMFTVDPVNENLSMAGIEWINDYLAAPQVLNDMGTAEYAITQIAANADHFQVELGNIEGMTTEEVVNRYLQLLHDREAYATDWGVSLIGLSDEIAQIELFQRTFGESNAVTLDMVRWVGDNIRNFDYDSPNAVDNVIRTYLTTQIVQGQYPQVGELDLESANLHDLALYYQKNIGQPALTTSEGLDYINLERGRVAELLDAMRGEYDRSVYPDASLLLMVGQILWDPADWVITGAEIKRQIDERDFVGAGVNGVLLALPFVAGWMDDLVGLRHAPDDLGIGRGSTSGGSSGGGSPPVLNAGLVNVDTPPEVANLYWQRYDAAVAGKNPLMVNPENDDLYEAVVAFSNMISGSEEFQQTVLTTIETGHAYNLVIEIGRENLSSQSRLLSDVLNWGEGATDLVHRNSLDAAQRVTELVEQFGTEYLTSRGITLEMAINWRKLYISQAIHNPANPAAIGRAVLMDQVVELLSGSTP